MSQIPDHEELCVLSLTVHSVEYSGIKSYSQKPLVKPAMQVHRNVCGEISSASVSVPDSVQAALF